MPHLNHYTYLALMLASLAYPLAQSFEHRLKYWRQWKYLWPGVLANAAFFLSWDALFTSLGVWSFNPAYVLGYYAAGLPLEEWLFFLVVPYACVFIYECVRYFGGPNTGHSWAPWAWWALAATTLAVALLHPGKLYTGVKLGFTGLALIVHWALLGRRYMGVFLVAYLFTLIPFALVNGVLTYLPVVSYNDAENLGIRIGHLVNVPFLNIPIEDTMYSLLMLLITVSIYEHLRNPGLAKTEGPLWLFLAKKKANKLSHAQP